MKMKRTGPMNLNIKKLIVSLEKQSKKEKVKVWAYLAEKIAMPKRKRVAVNIDKIERLSKKDEVVIVPGKLLSKGLLTKPLKVASLNASRNAVSKITDAKGEYLSIEELMKKNPKGKKVRVIM